MPARHRPVQPGAPGPDDPGFNRAAWGVPRPGPPPHVHLPVVHGDVHAAPPYAVPRPPPVCAQLQSSLRHTNVLQLQASLPPRLPLPLPLPGERLPAHRSCCRRRANCPGLGDGARRRHAEHTALPPKVRITLLVSVTGLSMVRWLCCCSGWCPRCGPLGCCLCARGRGCCRLMCLGRLGVGHPHQ